MVKKNNVIATIVLAILLFLFSIQKAYATSCSDIFPGPKPFTTNSVDSIESGVTCNGGSCSNPPSFTAVDSFPSISPSGDFSANTITNGIYQHSGWGLGDNAQVSFSGSGTAVIYFKDNSVVINKNTDINKGGNPANVILIFKGKLKIEEGAEISAFIYVKGNETTIEKNSTIDGGIAARRKLILKENSTYTYAPSDLNNLDTQGFCTVPTPSVDHYEITHDAIGSNCASESVTIKACADTACSSLYTSPTSLNFQADGVTKSTPSFTGSTIITFDHTVAETMTLSVDSPSVSPNNALVCKDGVGSSCDIVFNACASCSAVFPAGYNQATSSSEQLANFPVNNSSVSLLNSTTLPRGENFYLDSVLDSSDEITVGPVAGGETSARLYLRAGVLWHNTKINQSGNPEDLIIVVDGAITISGASTVINAIIYVKGTSTVSGGGIINGAITSVGGGAGSANFNASYISNADFNGMCDATPVVDHYEIHHDNIGTTCGSEQITVKACIDSACSFLSSEAISLNFQADGVTKNALSFTGSSTFTFDHTTAETLSLSVDSPSLTANNALKCIGDGSNSCNTEFFACPNCSDVFGSGIATFNNGTAYVDSFASITNQSSTNLVTTLMSIGSGASCNGTICTLTNTNAATMVKPSFINPSYSIPANGQLSGDYVLTDDIAFNQTNLSIAGPTRIYVTGSLFVNQSIANNNDAGDLIIFVDGNIAVSPSGLEAYIYANGYLDLNSYASYKGAFTSGLYSILRNNSSLEYVSPTSTNFSGLCLPSQNNPVDSLPIASFQFDACQDLVSGDTLLDSIGTYNGQAWQTPIESKHVVGLSADYSSDGSSDYALLPNTLLNTVGDFSLSFWLNPQTFSDEQTILSARKESATDNLGLLIKLSQNKNSVEVEIDGSNETFNLNQTLVASNWYHFAVRRLGSDVCIYLNGVSQTCKNINGNSLSIRNGSFVLAQEIGKDGQYIANGEDLTSYIDEMLFYHTGITDSLVNTVYTNQLAGKNHDGTERAGACLIGNWQFENDFLDAIISDPHNLSPANNPLFGISNPGPANTSGSLSTCTYVKFDGSNYASVNDTGAFNTDQLTVSAWVYPTSNPSSGLRSLVSKDEHFEFHINSSGKLYWWWTNSSNSAHTLTSNATIPLNTWTHVAVVFTNGAQNMYVNGALDTNSSHSDGLADSPCDFYIGTDVATNTSTQCGGVLTSRNYQGYMDEVKIYTRALPLVEIQADMNVVHSCSALGVDHYRLELTDNQGLTCEAESMTLKACSDANCTSLVAANSSVNLSPSPTATTSWGPNENYTFSEQQVFTFSNTAPADITYGLDAGTSTNSFRCFVTGVGEVSLADCKTSFSDVGFRFYNDNGVTPVIPTQLSGKPSDVGYLKQDIFLQAVKTDDNTGSCTGAFPAGGDVPVDLSYTCTTGTCSNSVTLTNNSNAFSISKDTYDSKSLRFDADSKAYFSLKYPDAGKIQINAKKDITVGSITKNISESSNAFVVRPFGFKLEFPLPAENNLAFATNASGDVFKKTDEDFSLKATAMQWDVGEDSDNNGHPDNFSNLANNAIANHFDNEKLVVLPSLILPSPGVAGSIVESVGNDFSNSTLTNKYTYSEVGIINLNAAIDGGNYLSSTETIQGEITNIGRFVPAAFTLATNPIPIFNQSCNAAFTYFGQSFTSQYSINAISNTSNLNSITLNYTGDFAKSTMSIKVENNQVGTDFDSNALYRSHDEFEDTNSVHRLTQPSPSGAGTWNNGIFTSAGSNFELNRDTSPDGPYTNVQFVLMLDDGESPTINITELFNRDENPDANNLPPNSACTIDDSCSGLVIGGVSEFKYGRVTLENSYGSELEEIRVPMKVESWDNLTNTFKLNDADNCTDYALVDLVTSPIHSKSGSSGTFKSGEYDTGEGLFLDAAGSDVAIDVEFNVPAYLMFDWNNDGLDENPSSVIQFGRYRGNDRIIYWREQ